MREVCAPGSVVDRCRMKFRPNLLSQGGLGAGKEKTHTPTGGCPSPLSSPFLLSNRLNYIYYNKIVILNSAP
jgi:hypothetical protein